MTEYKAITDFGVMLPITLTESIRFEGIRNEIWGKHHCRFMATIIDGVIVRLDSMYCGYWEPVQVVRHLNGAWCIGDNLKDHKLNGSK